MNLSNKILIGLAFIFLGGLTYLNKTYSIGLTGEDIFGAALILYSLPSTYLSLGNSKRAQLFLSVIIFLVGIALLIGSNFDLVDTRGLVFASVLFIAGAGFTALFFENTGERIFLAAGLILMMLGYLSTNIFKELGLLVAANYVANTAGDFWPVVLILAGMNVFLMRKK